MFLLFNKIFSFIKSPISRVLNRIHYIAFVIFLNNRYNGLGQIILRLLPKIENDFKITEIKVPVLWMQELFYRVKRKSSVFAELGQERIGQGPKEPRYPMRYQSNHLSSDKDLNINTFKPKSSLYDTLITIYDVLISFSINHPSSNLNYEMLEYYSTEIADKIDRQIVGSYKHTLYSNTAMIDSITINKYVVNRISRGQADLSGYIRTKIGLDQNDINADDLKTAFFHLPMKARQTGKWYMNSSTGLNISVMKDGSGNYIIDQRDNAQRTEGVPDRLLNHPIIYNDEMRNKGVVIILGDLSHAYTIVLPDFAVLSFDTLTEYNLMFKMGGDVVHPEYIKVMRTSNKEQPKSLSVNDIYADQELDNIEISEKIDNQKLS